MKRIVGFLLAALLLLGSMSTGAFAAGEETSGGSAAEVLKVALSQLGYKEGRKGYTKYGDWYGFPKGAWCDMFVSWCAREAGVPKEVFPRAASCTLHFNSFRDMGRYHISASRGGSYVPQQGDLIFFYNPARYPSGSVAQHVGLVLCVENGWIITVEGNTITYRKDYEYTSEVLPSRKYSKEPTDYVCIKRYQLTEKNILGYANPNYADRTPLAHKGFVDLAAYPAAATAFETLASDGILAGTSSYTCSALDGMTRAEFVSAVARLFRLPEARPETLAYSDLSKSSPYYAGVMAARSAGLLDAGTEKSFHPTRYASGEYVQEVLSKALKNDGRADQKFRFQAGDMSYMFTPYAIRGDIANALYTLRTGTYAYAAVNGEDAERLALQVMANGNPVSWKLLTLDGEIYAAMQDLTRLFPQLEEVPDEPEEAAETEQPDEVAGPKDADAPKSEEPAAEAVQAVTETESDPNAPVEPETAAPETKEAVEAEETAPEEAKALRLRCGEAEETSKTFTDGETRYVQLSVAARLLGVEVRPNPEAGTLELLFE